MRGAHVTGLLTHHLVVEITQPLASTHRKGKHHKGLTILLFNFRYPFNHTSVLLNGI